MRGELALPDHHVGVKPSLQNNLDSLAVRQHKGPQQNKPNGTVDFDAAPQGVTSRTKDAGGPPFLDWAMSMKGVPQGRIPFQSYGASQGLSNLAIWCLEQDTDGFLWVGTEDGLFRYDGMRFEFFGRDAGLRTTWIRTLCAAQHGRLWIGTTLGLALRQEGRIRHLGESDGLPEAEVFAIAPDAENRLWVATDRGLFRELPGDTPRFEGVSGWPEKGLARWLWMDGNSVYVTHGLTLFRYDLRDLKAPKEVMGPWKERLDAVLRDGQGRFWVRSRGGLWMQPRPGDIFQDLSKRVGPAAYDGALRLTSKGILLIPTANGLVRLQGETWERIGVNQGMPTPYVNRAMEDREGCLWAGGLGLHRNLAREAWQQYTHQNGISGGVVWSILQDRRGSIFAGSTNGLCEAREGKWTVVPETRDQAFLALTLAPDGALWIGGAPARLRRWVPGTSQWLELSKPTSTIICMAFDSQENLWVGTRREGLFRVVKRGSSFEVQSVQAPGMRSDERILSMSVGKGGRIWMPSANGLLLLEDGKLRRLGTEDGLKSVNLFAAYECSSGELWTSYQDVQGLSRYRYKNGRLELQEHLDHTKGFTARKANYLREDTKNRLWVGTSQGAIFYDGKAFHQFTVADGLPGDDCNGSAFLAESNGDVWIGSLGGLAHFKHDLYEGSPKPPASYVLSAQYGGKLLASPFSSNLAIPKKDASIEFRFTGLTYLNENRVIHQVRLVGLENGWRDTDIRQARYTNLGPGSYRFEVRAGFGNGDWGTLAVMPFRVLPAWYQTWWFRTLAALGFCGLVVLVIRTRVAVLKKHNQELERLVEVRTHALAEANETLRQLTVTDPLTGLKNRRFLDLTIEDDLAKVHRDYQTIQRGRIDRMPSNVDMIFFMVDLDHFKAVNDTYGHAAGDLLLKQVRDRLLEAVRDSDTVVRWGGEEFLVIARYTDRQQGNFIASRILELIRSRPFDIGNGVQISKTCSLGYCPYPTVPSKPDALNWHRVVEVADRCLYAAKQSGRNGWVGIQGQCMDPDSVLHFLSSPEGASTPDDFGFYTSFPDVTKLRWW